MIDRFSSAATIAVRHLGAYSELIASDLDAASRQVRRRLVVAVVMAAACVFAVAMLCLWIIAASWETDARGWVLAGLLLLFVAIAAGAYWRFTLLEARKPRVLAQTAREWAKDRQLLEELLARDEAEVS